MPPPRHESTDADPRVVALIAGSLAVLVAMGLAVGLGLFGHRSHGGELAPAKPAEALFQNGPAAQTSVAQSWDEYERDTRLHLEGYGWIDRKAGVVRIPIDRAIGLVADGLQGAGSAEREANPGP